MTDKEIIKALEVCTSELQDCGLCPLLGNCDSLILENQSLSLIKRQQAEIERLKIENQSLRGMANEHFGKTEQLKTCPFCGGKAVIHECVEFENESLRAVYSGKIGVHCEDCHVATTPFDNKDSAIKAWNRRYDNDK